MHVTFGGWAEKKKNTIDFVSCDISLIKLVMISVFEGPGLLIPMLCVVSVSKLFKKRTKTVYSALRCGRFQLSASTPLGKKLHFSH